MAHEIIVPSFGEDVSQIIVVHWFFDQGDNVQKGDVVVEIQAEKAVLEIEAPADGVLLKKYVDNHQAFTVPKVLGFVGQLDEEVPEKPPVAVVSDNAKALEEEFEPAQQMSLMRSVIAQKMSYSKSNIPHFYVKDRIDMTELIALRKEARREYKFKASINDIIIKAAALTIKENPKFNSVCLGEMVQHRKNINIGIAVALEQGLITPTIRNADQLSLNEIHSASLDLTSRARSKKLVPHEYKGASFTVSNMGMLGIEEFTAIIQPGQCAIMSVGKTVDTPLVIKGEIVIRTVINVVLASDHRLIDGVVAAKFLKTLKRKLEDIELWKTLILL